MSGRSWWLSLEGWMIDSGCVGQIRVGGDVELGVRARPLDKPTVSLMSPTALDRVNRELRVKSLDMGTSEVIIDVGVRAILDARGSGIPQTGDLVDLSFVLDPYSLRGEWSESLTRDWRVLQIDEVVTVGGVDEYRAVGETVPFGDDSALSRLYRLRCKAR